jgi:hypothetical protein
MVQYRLIDKASYPYYATAWYDNMWPVMRAKTLREEYCNSCDDLIVVEVRVKSREN